MTDSFWTGGPKAHQKAIAKQHKQKLELLDTRLADCSCDDERAEVEKEIQTAKDDYQTELKSSPFKLF